MENLKTEINNDNDNNSNNNDSNTNHVNFFTKMKWGDYDDNEVKTKDNVNVENIEKVGEEQKDNSVVWEVANKQELFKKVVNKYNKKQNILIVYELKEFIKCLGEHKKPNIDFIIDMSAHCEHTYKGTLCKNIRNCNKIHIQRCIKGESCTNKKCSYIHKYNMPDEMSQKNFEKTMVIYNKIKPNKKVK